MTLYNIYQGDSDSPNYIAPTWAVEEDDLYVLANKHLAGGGEVTLSGRTHLVSGKTFQVYKLHSEMGFEPAEIAAYFMNQANNLYKGKIVERLFLAGKSFNVTKEILKRTTSEIPEPKNPIMLPLRKDQVFERIKRVGMDPALFILNPITNTWFEIQYIPNSYYFIKIDDGRYQFTPGLGSEILAEGPAHSWNDCMDRMTDWIKSLKKNLETEEKNKKGPIKNPVFEGKTEIEENANKFSDELLLVAKSYFEYSTLVFSNEVRISEIDKKIKKGFIIDFDQNETSQLNTIIYKSCKANGGNPKEIIFDSSTRWDFNIVDEIKAERNFSKSTLWLISGIEEIEEPEKQLGVVQQLVNTFVSNDFRYFIFLSERLLQEHKELQNLNGSDMIRRPLTQEERFFLDEMAELNSEFSSNLDESSKNIEPSNILNRQYNYSIDNGKEALNVTQVADEVALLVKHFSTTHQEGQMIGVFGRWGRGKTFLIKKVVEILGINYHTEKIIDKSKSNFLLIKFNAWKYKTAETSWAHLYEVFADKFYISGGRSLKLFRRIVLNINRYGIWEAVAFLIPLFGSILWLCLGSKFKIWLLFSIGFYTLLGLYLLKRNFSTKAISLIRKYSIKKNYNQVLGLQAEIQSEIRLLLSTWLPDKKAWWNSIRASNKKILLVVDDLDRCDPENIVGVLDAIRVMLEDPEILKRVVVIAAADERILKKAIDFKYKKFDSESKIDLAREYIDKLFVTGIKLNVLDEIEKIDILKKYTDGKINPELELKYDETVRYDGSSEHDRTSPEEVGIKIQNEYQLNQKQNTDKDSKLVTEKPLITSSANYEINMVEEGLLNESLLKLDDPTPRQIRIFYYRYLMCRNFAFKEGVYQSFSKDELLKDKSFIRLLLRMIVDKTNDFDTKFNEEDFFNKYLEEMGSALSKESRIELKKIVEMMVPY
ncbi:MAG TPA: P-loop NTPase fold protein [Flavobacteriales bacterium]|nr:P-loop NTPase fold protein [Flavobacteriales bacterium]